MNRQHLLSRLAIRGWRVAYSSGALCWWDRKGSGWTSNPFFGRILELDGVTTFSPGRLAARWPRLASWDSWAIEHHSRWIRRRVACDDTEVVVMLFHPLLFRYVRYLEPCKVHLHVFDVYSKQSWWRAEHTAMLGAALKRADLVTAVSEPIARSLTWSQPIRILPNGVDFDSFASSLVSADDEPLDLRTLGRPRIGYVGTLNRKVDFRLIQRIAELESTWNWVLIGRTEEDDIQADVQQYEAFSACRRLSNVHFLGERHHGEIARYLRAFDVNAMCYRVDGDGWWSSGYPLKLHEYLAAGQPVVSASMEAVLPFSGTVAIAQDFADWRMKLSSAIAECSDPEARRGRQAVARSNSWDIRVDELERLLREIAPVAV